MKQPLYTAAFFFGLLCSAGNAGGGPATAFLDGRWSGGIETGSNGTGSKTCWAATTFGDGTAFTLALLDDGTWHLRLSNPVWHLPSSHRYVMIARVDFYPELRITAEATSRTRLEIGNLDQISLLGLIENGHTIELTSDGFNEKYDLEGSAKIIERIRNCFADQLAVEMRPIVQE